ncbi:MAG: HAD family hydrolase [Planctomycetota bacterium]|nr:HAD family hydrolase [Planctomycetota bacterium]
MSSPESVKLIPGVELALKSLSQAGYKLVVVTNQSGVARGILTEEQLEAIHAEMRRQLSEGGAHLDAVFYCPFHPEGTVVEYAKESELRKPRPGMLLKAATQMDIDLSQSWMVGDSPRDIEAGQRAGCRTIRVRMPGATHQPTTEESDEDTQADLTVRNLVEAAKAILRSDSDAPVAGAPASSPESAPAAAAGTVPSLPAQAPDVVPTEADLEAREIQREILACLRQMTTPQDDDVEEFRFSAVMSMVTQFLAILALGVVIYLLYHGEVGPVTATWGMVALTTQLMALTCTAMSKSK